jgi:hypothetical protein
MNIVLQLIPNEKKCIVKILLNSPPTTSSEAHLGSGQYQQGLYHNLIRMLRTSECHGDSTVGMGNSNESRTFCISFAGLRDLSHQAEASNLKI